MQHHFLQSTAWQAFQEALGRTTFRRSGDGWEFLAILERGKGNTRLYCPYGPVARDAQAFQAAVDALVELAKSKRVTFVRVEPTVTEFAAQLKQQGWRKVTYQHLQPAHTNIVDLSQDSNTLLSAIGSSNRNLFRNYQKKGLVIHQSTDPEQISIFLELIHKVAARTGMRPHADHYFIQQAKTLFPLGAGSLFYVTHQDTPITASIVYDDATTRYYAHTGNDSDYTKQRGGNILIPHMMLDAKEKGLQYFDFYGVAPPDAPNTHPWSGFSTFKRSFGGQDVTFGGTWELPINVPAYWLYRSYQALRRRR